MCLKREMYGREGIHNNESGFLMICVDIVTRNEADTEHKVVCTVS